MAKPDNLTVLLNKILAFKIARIYTLREIAKAIGDSEYQVSTWVSQRTRRPTAEVIFKLQDFAARQTIRIATNKTLQPQYRAAYHAACAMFPATGKSRS